MNLAGYSAIKFSAEWCAPCKMLDANLIKIKEEFPTVNFYSVDVDADSDNLVKKYGITSVPTIVLLKNGLEINKIVGAVLISPLRKAFRDLINGDENVTK
jgi:thioredoxin 1